MKCLLAAFLLALTACGSATKEGANQTGPAGAKGNDAKPTEAAAAAPADAAGLAAWREDSLRGCIGGARERAGPGVPVERHCACAVDREMEGRTLAELQAAELSGEQAEIFTAALRQCIAEIPG